MDPIESAQVMYGHFGRGDVASILEMLSPDVVWEPHWDSTHGIEYLMPGTGRAHARRFFTALASTIELSHFDPYQFLTGSDHVAVLVHLTMRHRETGKIFSDRSVHLWRLDSERRFCSFRHVMDTHAHWLAAQQS